MAVETGMSEDLDVQLFPGTREGDIEFLKVNATRSGVTVRPSGLQYKPINRAPEGAPKAAGTTPCRCHFRGMFTDLTMFDSSGDKPVLFAPEMLVPGLSEALLLMREGDRWEIVLPCHLAYGEKGAGPIPGGAALIFDLELLEVGAPLPPKQANGKWTLHTIAIASLISIGMALVLYQNLFLRRTHSASHSVVDVHSMSGAPGNPRVFFDIEAGGEPLGRVEFELFVNLVPKTVENFRALATGEKGVGKSGKKLHYKGSAFHRIIPGFMCQGGDITRGDGRGGESIYGNAFEDEWEYGMVHHTEPGLLSMANRGRNTGSSQFFITLAPTPWLNEKHVVFGRVAAGFDVVLAMQTRGSASGSTSEPVVVADCGELSPGGGRIEAKAAHADDL